MNCKICNAQTSEAFHATVLGRHKVGYWSCDECGLLATEKPYWLNEAYGKAIAAADTGLVSRNLLISHRLAVLLLGMFGREGRYVDMAGGTGLLVRLMRDMGFDFRWSDPYCKNVHAVGFEMRPSEPSATAVTAFEVLEHLEDPLGFIADALQTTRSDTLIFSTELFEGRPPMPGKWWYYSPETGQHIAFYQRRTLERIGAIMRLQFHTHSRLHMFTRKSISPLLFRALTGKVARLSLPLVRRLLPSKTEQDYRAMLVHGKRTED